MEKVWVSVWLLSLIASSSSSFVHEDGDGLPSECIPSQESPELKMAIIITRHGDRTPLTLFPNTRSEWPEGRGHLTGLGLRQLYELGGKFRERYVEEHKLIEPSYKPHEIYARSTQNDRTMRSAQSFLLGLYPPGTGPFLPSTDGDSAGESALPFGLDVVPVHSTPKNLDTLLYAYKICPRLQKMKNGFLNSALYLGESEKHSELLQQLSEILGEEIELQDVTAVSSLSRAERTYNRRYTLNDTFWEEKKEEILEISHFLLSHKYATHFMGQLGVGLLPREIQMRFEERVFDEGPRLLLLSAHDGGILSLFAFLQARYDKLPAFADHITFELYDTGEGEDEKFERIGEPIPEGRYYVKIRYKDLPLYTPACVGGIPGDTNSDRTERDGVCDLTFFLQFLEESTLENWPLECLKEESELGIVSYTYSENMTKILEFVEPINVELLEGDEQAM